MTSLIQLVCQADLCGSQAVSIGAAYHKLPIPGLEGDATAISKRFIQSEDDSVVGGFYEAGLKWTNHLYCFPMPRIDSNGTTRPSCNTDGNIPSQITLQLCECL